MDAAAIATSVLRGALLRCPRCGDGRIYRTWTTMHDACTVCGARFEPARGEFTGAVAFGQGIFGLVAMMGWFFLYLADAPGWAQWTWLIAWGVAIPLLTYRNLKGAWIGTMHAFGKLEPPGGNVL